MTPEEIRLRCLDIAASLHQRIAQNDAAVIATATQFAAFVQGPPPADTLTDTLAGKVATKMVGEVVAQVADKVATMKVAGTRK